MWDWITKLAGIDAVFFGCAVLGGSLFVIRVLLLLVGIGDGHDADADGDADMHAEMDHTHDHAMGAEMLSLMGVTAFFMMFGTVGLVMRHDESAGALVSVLVAAVAGVAMMWLVARCVRLMLRARSSGNIDFRSAVGGEGRVYLTIPSGGRGQIEVEVQGRLKVVDAVAEHPVELKTGAHVRVVRVIEGDTLVVERA